MVRVKKIAVDTTSELAKGVFCVSWDVKSRRQNPRFAIYEFWYEAFKGEGTRGFILFGDPRTVQDLRPELDSVYCLDSTQLE
jgi:hypothetical protein